MLNLVDLLNRLLPQCGPEELYYHESLSDGTELWVELTGTDAWETNDGEEYVKGKLGEQVFTAQISRTYSVNGDVVYAPLLYLGYKCEADTVTILETEDGEGGIGVVTDVVVYGGEMHEKNGLKDRGFDLFDSTLFETTNGKDELAVTHWITVADHTFEIKSVPGYIDQMTQLLLKAVEG